MKKIKEIQKQLLEYINEDQNIISVINFLFGLQFITPYLALYMQNQLQSLSQVALVFALQSASMVVFEIPSGLSADILGRKKSLIISGLLQLISLIILYVSSNIIGFFLFAIFQGVITGFTLKTSESYLYEALVKKKEVKDYKKHYINIQGMWSVGATVSSLSSGILAFFNIKSLIIASIVVSSFIPYLALFLTDIKGTKIKKKKNYFKTLNKILNHELFTKSITAFVLFNMFYLGVFNESLKLKSILFNYKTISIELIGLFTALFYFMTTLGLRASHYISQKLSDYKVFLIGLAGFITSTIFSMFTSGIVSVLIFSLNGFFFSINNPVISHLLNKNISNYHRATTISVFRLLSNFAQLVIGIWISIATVYIEITDVYLMMALLLITLLFFFKRMFVYLR